MGYNATPPERQSMEKDVEAVGEALMATLAACGADKKPEVLFTAPASVVGCFAAASADPQTVMLGVNRIAQGIISGQLLEPQA